MQKIMNLMYDFNGATLFDIEDINSSFAKGSLKVLYTGSNRNGSDISKAAIEDALPTLLNVPIVCHWDYEEGEIGGHDVDVVSDDDGNLRLRNLTEPCGVVPEHAKYEFEIEEDENGNEHEYLVIYDVILWKRQDCYNHIVNDLDGKVKHSMEITVKDGGLNASTGRYEIKKFEFTALCLLERDEPCFEGSELTMYSASHFAEKMTEMMKEFKETFNMVGTSQGVNNICPQEQSMEGGNKVLAKEIKDFNAEDLTNDPVQEFDTPAEPMEEPAEPAEEPATPAEPGATPAEPAEPAEPEGDPDGDSNEPDENPAPAPEEEFALQSQIREEIYRALEAVTITDEYGTWSRYWFSDYDPEANMIYCYDCVDGLLYGFNYGMDGDNVSIDFESKKRMKYIIVEFEDGDNNDNGLFTIFNELHKSNFEKSEVESKYQEASKIITAMETELTDLRNFKSESDENSMRQERENVFAKFEDLVGVEEFETLKEKCMEYDVETLEEKCFAIRGKNMQPAKFSHSEKAPRFIIPNEIDNTKDEKQPYGGIVEKYRNK